uniref:Secreted protein n=1 Tax=Pyxicephalus adspersus TaxID=30357 RepID=A0AAV3AKS9_PYXAD|nr:TPA: hypothetical protein GDO54_008413 [Pyxicephalus adspersus]
MRLADIFCLCAHSLVLVQCVVEDPFIMCIQHLLRFSFHKLIKCLHISVNDTAIFYIKQYLFLVYWSFIAYNRAFNLVCPIKVSEVKSSLCK